MCYTKIVEWKEEMMRVKDYITTQDFTKEELLDIINPNSKFKLGTWWIYLIKFFK